MYYHLTHELKYPIGPFHQELSAQFVHDRVAIAAPRGHAKSTWASFFYPLYMICENPGINILLTSATNALAEHWLMKIKRELENNVTIRQFYGSLQGGTWTREEIEWGGGRIMAKGSGKQIRGFRPDMIIIDDAETDDMVRSPTQRKEFDDWFNKTLTPTVKGDDTQILMVGTLLHSESFLAELINHGRFHWHHKLYRALKPDNTSLWPEMWPTKTLLNIREEIGEYAFEQEFQNNPIPDDKRTFQEKWLRYYKQEPSGCVYFTTVDPAWSDTAKSDFTAIVTCAVDAQENMYVVDVINEKLSPSDMIDAIFSVYARFKPATIGVETVAAQRLLKYNLEEEKKRRNVYPIFESLTSAGRRKNLRIDALQPKFQRGAIYLKEDQKDLITQLLNYPSTKQHDDIIDALAYMLDIIRPGKLAKVRYPANSWLEVWQECEAQSKHKKRHRWSQRKTIGI